MDCENSRFNLILHGILAIVATEIGFDICVPPDETDEHLEEPDRHKGFWGLPDSFLPIPGQMPACAPRSFDLCVPGYESTGAPIPPQTDEYTRYKPMDRVPDNIRAVISVPAPDVIKGYRFIEFPPNAKADNLQDTPPRQTPLVVVLSWTRVCGVPHLSGRPISIGGFPSRDHKRPDPDTNKHPYYYFDNVYNFCIYFEPFRSTTHSGAKSLDNMFVGASSGNLTTNFEPDDPPSACSKHSGIRSTHLLGLWELGYGISGDRDAGSSDACGPSFVG